MPNVLSPHKQFKRALRIHNVLCFLSGKEENLVLNRVSGGTPLDAWVQFVEFGVCISFLDPGKKKV